MIENMSPGVRRRLVTARFAGMTNGAEAALAVLADTNDFARSPLDLLGIGLLKSEVYALDLRPQEARAAFEKCVEAQLPDLDHRVAAVVADNKAIILLSMFDASGTDEFYHFVDARRILGIELRDYSAILQAAIEAAKGKHFNALPVYWQQLRAAYNLQNWRARLWAEQDFAQECVRLGLFDEAAYHAMLADSDDTTDEVAKNLMAVRSTEQITKTLEKLLSVSALKAHAIQVARMLGRIADAVPDDRLVKVSEFLMRHADYNPTSWHDAQITEQTWRAIEALAPRFDCITASSFAAKGLKHPILENGGPLRVHLIKSLNALTATLPAKDFASAADVALSLITERRSDIDYNESLNLLCHIAVRGNDALKSRISGAVFPAGRQISDALLMQAGPHLGWKPQHPESFSNGARETAKAVRKQVQRLAVNEEQAKIGGYGTFTITSPEGRIVVHMQGAMHWVDALVPHRALIEDLAIKDLLDAMLEMITEPENLVANRAALTATVGKFADRISPEVEQRVVNALAELARGNIVEPSSGQTHAEAVNPMNPVKVGGGDPIHLRGAALLSLAEIDKARPNASSVFHSGILLTAITSPDPESRRYGLAAADLSGILTVSEATAVALAGLDPDPRVARSALRALVKPQTDMTFEPVTWHIIIRCIEAAVNSTDTGYRREGAHLLQRIKDFPSDLKARMEAVSSALHADICHSVRQAMRQESEVV